MAGVDRLLADRDAIARLRARRVGLLTNHACASAEGVPAALALRNACAGGDPGTGVVRLFAPEHSVALERHAGEDVADGRDPLTGLPCTSLYGANSADGGGLLDGVDVLVVDLRDVGVRCYTYAASAATLAREALARGLEVVVCDRPNPLGPAADGPRPEPALYSLVCFFDVPFIHGRTLAELVALHAAPELGRAQYSVYPADVELAPPLGWTGPSPALAHPDAVALYPALVLLEGTNVSEGRRSAHAFRSVAAPDLDVRALADAIATWETGFRGEVAEIVAISDAPAIVRQPAVVLWPSRREHRDPLALAVRLLDWLHRHYRAFEWIQGPDGTPVVDRLIGTQTLRADIDGGSDPATILDRWRQRPAMQRSQGPDY